MAALEAARALLVEAGPQAVTLKAVAGRIGRTHANLLHHFGSAAGLQKALDEAYKKLPPSCKRAEEGGGPQLRKPCHVKPYL